MIMINDSSANMTPRYYLW